jgi:hypothetical protein
MCWAVDLQLLNFFFFFFFFEVIQLQGRNQATRHFTS